MVVGGGRVTSDVSGGWGGRGAGKSVYKPTSIIKQVGETYRNKSVKAILVYSPLSNAMVHDCNFQ